MTFSTPTPTRAMWGAGSGRAAVPERHDHRQAGPAPGNLVVSCEYLRGTHELRLSDHAALTATLDADADRVETNSPTAAAADSAPTLF